MRRYEYMRTVHSFDTLEKIEVEPPEPNFVQVSEHFVPSKIHEPNAHGVVFHSAARLEVLWRRDSER